jgi:hypothetical protein
MAHFAKLDSNNIVTQVLVVANEVLLEADGTESELKGKQFLNSLLGTSTWKQTSYNGTIRKNYAGIGYKYDSSRDAFIPPKPYESWILNETNCIWESPIEHPTDGNLYNWDEANQEWVFSRAVVTP